MESQVQNSGAYPSQSSNEEQKFSKMVYGTLEAIRDHFQNPRKRDAVTSVLCLLGSLCILTAVIRHMLSDCSQHTKLQLPWMGSDSLLEKSFYSPNPAFLVEYITLFAIGLALLYARFAAPLA